MAGGPHALDILLEPGSLDVSAASIVVLHGDEPFLAGRVLGAVRDQLVPDEADRDWAWREFAGDQPLDPRDVFDEAATIPMFATATRAAVVRQADAFVTASRELLEHIASTSRGRRGLILLDVRTFPATTRLAKAAAKNGLVIETTLTSKRDLSGWVRKWARAIHGITLSAAAAAALLERLAGNLGLIDQALARLAATIPKADHGKAIAPEAIDAFASAPGERPAWDMIDAAATGHTSKAIAELTAILETGESPIAIAAQTSAVLRKVATAARLLGLPAGGGRPAGVDQALRDAGVAAWPKAMAQAREALTQLGTARARRLPIWLRDLDLSLKGEASRGLRARLALERLFCRMTRPADGHQASAARSRRS